MKNENDQWNRPPDQRPPDQERIPILNGNVIKK